MVGWGETDPKGTFWRQSPAEGLDLVGQPCPVTTPPCSLWMHSIISLYPQGVNISLSAWVPIMSVECGVEPYFPEQ